jgi:osmotically-inducible protein OsmY
LAQRVAAALQDDPRTRDAAIDVVDENGIVTLTGSVATEDVREAAEEIAQQEEDVVEVINELRIEEDDDEGNIIVVAPPASDIHGALVSPRSDAQPLKFQ